MPDRTDHFVRLAFQNCPRPRLPEDFAARLAKHVPAAEQGSAARKPRYAPAAVWLFTGLLCLWVLRWIDWPVPPSWLAPALCAAVIYHRIIMRWLITRFTA